MITMINNEYELLKLSCFCEEFTSEIPQGYYGLYLANPKKRWKRTQINHKIADSLFQTHSLTFIDLKMIRYGEFYIFKIDEQMSEWGNRKLNEFCQTHPGVHFKRSPCYFFDPSLEYAIL